MSSRAQPVGPGPGRETGLGVGRETYMSRPSCTGVMVVRTSAGLRSLSTWRVRWMMDACEDEARGKWKALRDRKTWARMRAPGQL